MTPSTVSGGEQVVARINGLSGALRPRIVDCITAFAMDVTKLTKEKLSDDVLNVRTGRLRRSITPLVTEQAHAVNGTVGTNVEYARALELGFKGQVSVRSFIRQQTTAFGKSITPRSVSVKASSRNMNIKAHHFLSGALEQTTPPLVERLRALGVAR